MQGMDRRTLLASIGSATAAGLAGCSSVGSGGIITGTPTDGGTEDPTPPPTATSAPTVTETPEDPDLDFEFQPPDDPDALNADIRYREYSDEEVRAIRDEAEEYEYDTLFRNIDDRVGDRITGTVEVEQVINNDDHFILRVGHVLGSDPIVLSWTGDRFLEDDDVRFYGVVLGTVSYGNLSDGSKEAPAVSAAAIELLED